MFLKRLEQAVERSGGWLCVGLDPRPDRIPVRFGGSARGVLRHSTWLVDVTAAWAAAYKANLAFYLAWGPAGLGALRRIADHIHRTTEAPLIVDGKWGDIAATAQAYASAAEALGADAVTCTMYMGSDAVVPFLERELFAFVLALPSNPASRLVVDHGVPPVYLQVTALAVELEREHPGGVGLVVSATRPQAAGEVHRAAGHLPWLVPGVGAQGGDLRKLFAAAPNHTSLVNASRAVAGAPDPARAARELCERIRAAKETA